jgi:hypothetical protein
MMVATDHCNSVGKSAYLFLGFAHGESEITRGTYTIDMDLGKNFKTYQHRIICSKDLQNGLKLFKNRVANYDSELNLNIRPREYLINGLENRKKISSLAEEKKKKIMAKQKSVAKKIDNPVEERNKLLNSCLKDNRETSIKLKNTECEAYADGKAVDIGDNSSVNSGDDIKRKKKLKSENYDRRRYNKCYAEMTYAHQQRGLLKSNIEFSVKVRNTVCKAYAKGEDLDYEGKR